MIHMFANMYSRLATKKAPTKSGASLVCIG
jgi:hypothetical protein